MSLAREFIKSCAVSLPLLATSIPTMAEGAIRLAGPPVSLKLGGNTTIPIGHFEYCKTSGSRCDIRYDEAAPLHLTRSIWEKMVEVNNAVHQRVLQATDKDIYNTDERWTLPVNNIGDCEDIALEKRRLLNKAGISYNHLLMTVVVQTNGEGHAVLTVRTDHGDFILDNLRDREFKSGPYSVGQSEYRFLKIQSPVHTGRWQSIEDFTAPPTATARTSALQGPAANLH